jgi:hypothetical protein
MRKVALNIDRLSIPDKIIVARKILESMILNQFDFENPPVTIIQLAGQINDLFLAQQKSVKGSRADYVDRNKKLDTLIHSLKLLASYVQTVSAGDQAIILKAGMSVIRMPQRNKPVEAPANLSVLVGNATGSIIVKWKRQTERRQYQVDWWEDSEVLTNWTSGSFTTRSKTVLRDLPSGSMVWVRVRAIGAAGISEWSRAIKQRVI